MIYRGDLLPTPTAQAAKHAGDDRGERDDANLWAVATRLVDDDALLPTPRQADDGNGGGNYNSVGHQSTLPGTVREELADAGPTLLPTPVSRDHKAHGPRDISHKGEAGAPLSAIPSLLPTPNARDWKGGQAHQPDVTDAVRSLLPTPEAKNAHAGPDYARMNRDGSGGHDLVTAIAADDVAISNWGRYGPAIARWEAMTGPAPAPTEPNSKGNPRLHAPFAEWLMGWAAGWCTDPALGIKRNDQLRIIGNGVVPQQALAALRVLFARLAESTP